MRPTFTKLLWLGWVTQKKWDSLVVRQQSGFLGPGSFLLPNQQNHLMIISYNYTNSIMFNKTS